MGSAPRGGRGPTGPMRETQRYLAAGGMPAEAFAELARLYHEIDRRIDALLAGQNTQLPHTEGVEGVDL